MADGRVRNYGGRYEYDLIPVMEYFITDQQGNTRISFEDNNGTASLIQENSYYAFGMQMTGGYTPATNPNKKLYNAGSEWQDDIDGLADYYSTFFREYDPVIGRFNGVDPMAEATDNFTTYAYANNNPVMMNDPLGDYVKHPRPTDWREWGYLLKYDMRREYNLWHIANYAGGGRGWDLGFGIGGEAGGLAGNGPGPLSQRAAKGIVNNIKIFAGYNFVTKNNFSLKFWLSQPSCKIQGTYLCKGTNNQITDTRLDVAKRFNMFVSNSTDFKVDESEADEYGDYESMVVAMLLNNFVQGSGPENYVFPTNGIISSKFLNSDIVKAALADYNRGILASNQSVQYSFGGKDLVKDIYRNGTIFSITGLVGSGTVTITPTAKGLQIKIFNITSLTSGDLFKNPVSDKNWPKSIIRNPDAVTPYGNISQTFNLLIPYTK